MARTIKIEARLVPTTIDLMMVEVGQHLIIVGEGDAMVCIGVDTGEITAAPRRHRPDDDDLPERLMHQKLLTAPEKKTRQKREKQEGAAPMGRPPMTPLIDPELVLDVLRRKGSMTAMVLGDAMGMPRGSDGARPRQRLGYALQKLKAQHAVYQTEEMDGSFYKIAVGDGKAAKSPPAATGPRAAKSVGAAAADPGDESSDNADNVRLVGNARQLLREAIRNNPDHVGHLPDGVHVSSLGKTNLLDIARALGIDVPAIVAQAQAEHDGNATPDTADLFTDESDTA